MKDKRGLSRMEVAYESFLSVIQEYGMQDSILQGVLLGFSGGPDSMLLLHLFLKYRKKCNFPLLAVHVHHGIRGENADRDARFAKQTCDLLGVDFRLVKYDVLALAKESRIGIEEAARNARYSCFNDIIRGRKDISTIALGHNSTDNLETVIFHLLRGCGTGGLAGIAPKRDNVIRPLIHLKKEEILAALNEERIPFVTDETNTDVSYTRNYIRNEILPLFSRLSSSPEVSVRRVCRNLICDNDFLEQQAEQVFSGLQKSGYSRSILADLHPSIFARVMQRWAATFGIKLVFEHMDALRKLLSEKSPFSYDLPGGLRFFADVDACYLEKRESCLAGGGEKVFKVSPDCPIRLVRGAFLLSYGECQNISPNIYNFSINANLASAIIEGDLFLRFRKNGDAYYYGGMTHKLKKIFNDRKLPLRERETLPILCDKKGIVWVPGFGVRDDGGRAEHALNAAFFF